MSLKSKDSARKWIRLPGLPVELYDGAIIRSIVNSFASFLAIDECTKQLASLKYARACVEVDVQEKMPEKIWISLPEDRGFFQNIVVEGNLLYCEVCRKHGHRSDECRKAKALVEVTTAEVLAVNSPLQDPQAAPQRASQGILAHQVATALESEMEEPWTEVQNKRSGRARHRLRRIQSKSHSPTVPAPSVPTGEERTTEAPVQVSYSPAYSQEFPADHGTPNEVNEDGIASTKSGVVSSDCEDAMSSPLSSSIFRGRVQAPRAFRVKHRKGKKVKGRQEGTYSGSEQRLYGGKKKKREVSQFSEEREEEMIPKDNLKQSSIAESENSKPANFYSDKGNSLSDKEVDKFEDVRLNAQGVE